MLQQSTPQQTLENPDLKLWREKLLLELKQGNKASKKLLQALKKGVPLEHRGLAWQSMIGNDLRITDKLYELLLERAHLHMTQLSVMDQLEAGAFRKNLKVIEEDLHRTFGELGHFRQGNPLYQPLKNVLIAYSMLRPDLGYVQGMSYVAGCLLIFSTEQGSEKEAFRSFANLMNRELLFTFYSFDMERVNVVFHVFMNLMRDRLPKLYGVFKATNISCSIFLFEWIVALYSNIFALETSARLWDSYLFHGDYFMIKVALAICCCLEQHLIQQGVLNGSSGTGQFEMMVLLFKNVKNFVSEEGLFQALESHQACSKFGQDDYEKVKKQVEAMSNLERLI
ncbi:hypothetical protein FGO68_gene16015 [Halteria grandinella]|uniref:Rab-GAP TBC domain-containing protein n=1 Tax=Halteria grandinella TaxID=5974 RepID=A0A8J8NFA9_HALGN|nr:hypothetical protein FGO68_gene16015 [Halteria grandinella]